MAKKKQKKENFDKWSKQKIKKLDWFDMKLVKLSTAAFTLMFAKLWPEILGLDWYWYLGIAVVLMLRPFKRAYLR